MPLPRPDVGKGPDRWTTVGLSPQSAKAASCRRPISAAQLVPPTLFLRAPQTAIWGEGGTFVGRPQGRNIHAPIVLRHLPSSDRRPTPRFRTARQESEEL